MQMVTAIITRQDNRYHAETDLKGCFTTNTYCLRAGQWSCLKDWKHWIHIVHGRLVDSSLTKWFFNLFYFILVCSLSTLSLRTFPLTVHPFPLFSLVLFFSLFVSFSRSFFLPTSPLSLYSSCLCLFLIAVRPFPFPPRLRFVSVSHRTLPWRVTRPLTTASSLPPSCTSTAGCCRNWNNTFRSSCSRRRSRTCCRTLHRRRDPGMGRRQGDLLEFGCGQW